MGKSQSSLRRSAFLNTLRSLLLAIQSVNKMTGMTYNLWNVEGLNSVGTDLGSLIGNTQYGNFSIFLQFTFYVKSISVILKPQPNTAILSSYEFQIFGNF